MKTKRLLIATTLGLLSGFACYAMASSGPNDVTTMLAINIILGRTLIGFGIGISRFKMKHWAIHGLLLGFIFSLPAGFGAMLEPENPDFSHNMMFIATVVMGMVYGFLIELLTTLVFKAKQ